MFRLAFLILIIMATLLVGQGFLRPERPTPAPSLSEDQAKWPSRRQLQRAAWNTGGWLLLHEEGKEHIASLLEPLKKQSFRGINIEIYSWQKVPDSLLQRYPTIIIGTQVPEVVRQKIGELPDLTWQRNDFGFGDVHLQDSSDLVQLSYLPGAWQDTLPMHLIWAASETLLSEYVEERLNRGFRSFFWSSWGYEIMRGGETQFLGYFNDSTWVMDQEIHFAFDEAPNNSTLAEVANFESFDGAPLPDESWQENLRAVQRSIQAFSSQPTLPPLEIKIYPTVERKALRTKSMEQVHLSTDANTVHLVMDSNFEATEWGLPFCSWLRSALGDPADELLELGLSFQWMETLRGRPWRSWVRDLAEAQALPPAHLLLDARTMRQEFPLIGQLAVGAWVDYLLQTKGREYFLSIYQEEIEKPSSSAYQDWINWLTNNYPTTAEPSSTPTSRRLNGFTLAHEGYRIYNGYGGERSKKSLRAMQEVGIDAVAIVPYSFLANPNRPDPIPVARRAGSENDESVLFSHFSAQALGQYTLLKPQIWLGSGSWPGDVTFGSEKDWDAFFRYYKRWILHYALLAEMYGFDGFCIGTELRYTTLQKPEEWQALIRDIRKVYHGDLTYAANWGEECEKLSFWPELDFIGINCYYPLHKGDEASDQELQKGAERVVEKLEGIHQRAQRPIWFTEIGYRSAEAPWKSPHAEADRRAIDEQAQARCFEAILAATQDENWIKGYFWWKWPSDLSHDESNGRGYTPVGKPAQTVLAKYYLGN